MSAWVPGLELLLKFTEKLHWGLKMVQGNVLIKSQLIINLFLMQYCKCLWTTEDEGFLMEVLKNSKLFMQSQWVVTRSLFLSFLSPYPMADFTA